MFQLLVLLAMFFAATSPAVAANSNNCVIFSTTPDLTGGSGTTVTLNTNYYFSTGSFNVSQSRDGKQCYYPGSCIETGTVTVTVSNVSFHGDSEWANGEFRIGVVGRQGCVARLNNGTLTCDINVQGSNNGNNLEIFINYGDMRTVGLTSQTLACELRRQDQLLVYGSCGANDQCQETPVEADGSGWDLCMQIPATGNARDRCIQCMVDGSLWTALGCIPTAPDKIIQTVIVIGLTLAGAVVLIMIIAGAFTLSTSQGDPNRTKEAKEMITSAIIGLLFIIFSVTILQFIGVSILHIPGFGEG